MIPTKIKLEDTDEEIRQKMISLFEDIYNKFYQINDKVFDFDKNKHKIKITPISVDSDN